MGTLRHTFTRQRRQLRTRILRYALCTVVLHASLPGSHAKI